ncbi:MAG: FecR domain-containing protein, partial [Acidobacteria bacterium]|nr:FecR domain-containing protein [Acidobacteriota bacterium]
MTGRVSIRCLFWAVMPLCAATLSLAADAPPVPAGQTAGKITALLPTAHVIRGDGKQAVTSDAAKGQELIWQDLVRTDKGGRARITLNDQSILSLGSQAELRIVKHDARAQQTLLEMTFGRVRAQVSTVTRDGGSFQVRTPTAVAGVIGTDFGTDASEPGITTFVCMSGTVQIGNSDPSVPGRVACAAGQTTTVKSGLPPSPPKPATQQQINQVIMDTEPASISAFAPGSALLGAVVDAVASGTHMAGLSSVSITGSGVQASLVPGGTQSSVTAHLVISAAAQPGPRTVTFSKVNGSNTAAIFTVIAP